MTLLIFERCFANFLWSSVAEDLFWGSVAKDLFWGSFADDSFKAMLLVA